MMPARYLRAEWRPLGEQTQPRMSAHDLIVLHTMAGTLAGTDEFFRDRGYGGTESHFGVGADGVVLQWQDLEHTADANGDGNRRCISIETADRGAGFPTWSGSDVPAWTDRQLAALAELLAWLANRYRIPLQLVADSRPGRRGVAYHRLGIDPWRVAGGEKWSTAAGKVCPGDRRIAQIPDLIDEARRIAGREEDALSEQFEKDARARLLDGMKPGALAALERDLRGDLSKKQTQLDRIEAQLARVLAALPPTTTTK